MFRSLFDPNSAFSRGMERVWTLVVLNVLWVLCSLPVVTIGPSTAALYQVLGKVMQGEDSPILILGGMTMLRILTGRAGSGKTTEIFRRMAGELQVCPAGMAAHAGGAGSVRL